MKSFTRFKTAKEHWYALIKFSYMFFAFPMFLLAGIVTASALTSTRSEDQVSGLPLFSILTWLGVLIPLVLFIYGYRNKARLLKHVASRMKSPNFFKPTAENEVYLVRSGKYLGFDINNGTILYVHRIRKGQVDVLGLTMKDWTHLEVEGNLFRVYTKYPELPCVEICTTSAQRWYDALGAMQHRDYTTPKPFTQYVNENIETLARDSNIQVPKMA